MPSMVFHGFERSLGIAQGSHQNRSSGSAWCTLFWYYCTWLDKYAVTADQSPSTDHVLWRFFTVLALWPWPLPWTAENMQSIVERKDADASALGPGFLCKGRKV